MRRFTSDYLAHTRRGLWDDRGALGALDLPARRRVLDVGCGTGAFTRVLREETGGTVVGLDADPALLAEVEPPRLVGDAARLPVADGAFDLVVCQALLVNHPAPVDVIREFARASSGLVAAVEPDNAAVTVESTVGAEQTLARRAREAYVAGVETDVTLGADAGSLFEAAGLTDVVTRRHVHRRTIEPPYSGVDVEGAASKARGDQLTTKRETLIAGGLGKGEYETLRDRWRSMGRDVVDQMQAEAYRRVETVPFYVTVGRG